MVNLVSKAEGVFGKLKDKVAEAKAKREQERAERKAEQEDRERKAEQLRAERLAMIEKEESEPSDDEEPYVAPIALPSLKTVRCLTYSAHLKTMPSSSVPGILKLNCSTP